jgi:hypothetical protein
VKQSESCDDTTKGVIILTLSSHNQELATGGHAIFYVISMQGKSGKERQQGFDGHCRHLNGTMTVALAVPILLLVRSSTPSLS